MTKDENLSYAGQCLIENELRKNLETIWENAEFLAEYLSLSQGTNYIIPLSVFRKKHPSLEIHNRYYYGHLRNGLKEDLGERIEMMQNDQLSIYSRWGFEIKKFSYSNVEDYLYYGECDEGISYLVLEKPGMENLFRGHFFKNVRPSIEH